MRKIFLLSILSFTLVFSPLAASAHKFVLEPDSFTAPQSGKAGVLQTFTEIIGAAEYSRYGTSFVYQTMTAPVEVVYKDGARSSIDADFEPYDHKTKSKVAPEASDSDYAQFDITRPGTVVINGKFTGTLKEEYGGGTSYSHIKTFLNLTNDGMATRRFGDDNVIEVVFAEEVPADGIKEGNVIKFRFYHKGAPLKNAPVFASY
ncbi:MAG: DUF4198 domain-containing protein, partial [Synergistaceae bacterium]|nr:DUF4198 domain-containing protein [Synergistaceae bacterium]